MKFAWPRGLSILGAALAMSAFQPSPPRAGTIQAGQGSPGGLTIQSALDLARAGDTVLVLPGEYKGHLSIPSGVTLRGRDGSDSTRLVGDGLRGILQAVGCDSSTRVEGFTFTAGRGTKLPQLRLEGGGGILAFKSALRIRDNLFQANRLDVGTGVGGGIALFDSPALLERNVFDANSANQGGALYARGCSLLVVRGNHAVHNNADEDGGAFMFDLNTVGLVEFNVLERNQATWGGGMEVGPVTRLGIVNNTVVANFSRQWGAGIFIVDCRPLLIRNLVAENRSGFKGGGIAAGRSAFPDLRCNLGWHNTPDNYFFVEDSVDVPGSGSQVEADPGLCSFLTGNFHPTPGGPADTEPCGRIGALDADCPKLDKILR